VSTDVTRLIRNLECSEILTREYKNAENLLIKGSFVVRDEAKTRAKRARWTELFMARTFWRGEKVLIRQGFESRGRTPRSGSAAAL